MLLKKQAMRNTEYALVYFNITSQVELRSPDKVTLIELGDDWVSFKAPKTSCALGHKLLLHFMPKGDVMKLSRGQLRSQTPFSLSIMSLVSEYLQISEASSEIKATFTQFSKSDWNEFLGKWKSVQETVDREFKGIKE
jgi:hypothetical protein